MNHKARLTDIGNSVLFEHVNFTVAEHESATAFWVEGLHFTRDPFRNVFNRNMWVNLGIQQFHLPRGKPMAFAGEVGVVVHDLKQVQHALEHARPQLAKTRFAIKAEAGTLRVTTPCGRALRLHKHGALPTLHRQGIPYVEFHVPQGAAEGIAAYYRELLGCPAAFRRRHAGAPGAVAEVCVGPHQTFWFVEQPRLKLQAHNNHVALYVTRYEELYQRLSRRDLIMEQDRGTQFRFCDIVDPGSGELLLKFEHEVRSLMHREYRRPLATRIPVDYPVD